MTMINPHKRASRKLAGLAALFAPAADCGWIGGYTETPVTVHGSWRFVDFLVGDNGWSGCAGGPTGASAGRSTKAVILVPRWMSRLSCSTLIQSAFATRETRP